MHIYVKSDRLFFLKISDRETNYPLNPRNMRGIDSLHCSMK